MKNRLSLSVAALLLVLVGVGAYWYLSPYVALQRMAAAAKAKDADKFNEGVDYPRLRDSLKGQLAAQVAKTVGAQPSNPFGAFGAMLGMAMVNQMVDAFVRPEMVMQMIKEGRIKADHPVATSSSAAPSGDEEPKWVLERQGVDRVIAIPQQGAVPVMADRLGLVFERSGFATWRLTELRISFQGQ